MYVISDNRFNQERPEYCDLSEYLNLTVSKESVGLNFGTRKLKYRINLTIAPAMQYFDFPFPQCTSYFALMPFLKQCLYYKAVFR